MKKTEVESVEISNRVFYRNSYVKSVDLANVPFVNNDMSSAFGRCYNLAEVKSIIDVAILDNQSWLEKFPCLKKEYYVDRKSRVRRISASR